MKKYKGIIYYDDDSVLEVEVEQYVWKENVLILYFEKTIDIIPYHAFFKASFEKIKKEGE
jgi:hypothetical protein